MTAPESIAALVQRGTRTLAGHSESPRLDAELLLCKVLGVSRPALIANRTELIAYDRLHAYDRLLARRVRGEPIAYLTGSREFWSLGLMVTADVLVPRPETELLVEHALDHLPQATPCSILDLGTGSGAIALAIASERPRASVTAVDISARALAVATDNAHMLHLKIDWRLGSWFDAVPGERFDVIVANPPYVAADDPMLPALAAEPLLALTPGDTGLEALTAIVEQAGRHLHPRGWLLLEHGSEQAGAVTGLLDRHGFSAISTHADCGGRPRVTLGTVYTSH